MFRSTHSAPLGRRVRRETTSKEIIAISQMLAATTLVGGSSASHVGLMFAEAGKETQNVCQGFDFTASAGEGVTVKVQLDDSTTQVNTFLTDQSGETYGGSPKPFTATAATSITSSNAVISKASMICDDVAVHPLVGRCGLDHSRRSVLAPTK